MQAAADAGRAAKVAAEGGDDQVSIGRGIKGEGGWKRGGGGAMPGSSLSVLLDTRWQCGEGKGGGGCIGCDRCRHYLWLFCTRQRWQCGKGARPRKRVYTVWLSAATAAAAAAALEQEASQLPPKPAPLRPTKPAAPSLLLLTPFRSTLVLEL